MGQGVRVAELNMHHVITTDVLAQHPHTAHASRVRRRWAARLSRRTAFVFLLASMRCVSLRMREQGQKCRVLSFRARVQQVHASSREWVRGMRKKKKRWGECISRCTACARSQRSGGRSQDEGIQALGQGGTEGRSSAAIATSRRVRRCALLLAPVRIVPISAPAPVRLCARLQRARRLRLLGRVPGP